MTTDLGGTRTGQKPHRNGKKNGHTDAGEAGPQPRVPPHNIDAERSLLGGVLLDREAPLKDLFTLCPAADFYRDAHRKVAEAVVSLAEDAISVDRVTVSERLTERGDLEQVGGSDFLEQLESYVPIAANLAYYAKIVHDKARARRLIEAASSVVQLGYDQHGDVSDFITEADKRIKSVVEDGRKKLPALHTRAIQISRELLTKTPPPRRFMLIDAGTGRGVCLRGKAGLFAAAGGTGKSSVFGQLAISLATGLTLFGPGGWAPVDEMRVLLLAGEDDREELERRLFFSARDIGAVSDESMAAIAKNVVAIPLAGSGCALTNDDSFSDATLLPETTFAIALREHVSEQAKIGKPYGLILIDPLSRFAGFDVEKDNSAATRWVQVIETLTAPECGSPGVLVAHHTKKRGADDRKSDAVDLIRGASALKDGVRWAAVLEQQKRTKGGPDLLTLKIVKANGVPPQLVPLILCRPNDGNEGSLRLATPDEIATNEKLAEIVKSRKEVVDELRTEIMKAMEPGRAYSRRDLTKMLHRRPGSITDAVNQLLTEGVLDEPRQGVLKLNQQLGLGASQVFPENGKHLSPAAQPSGSRASGSLPLLPFRAEGSREAGDPVAASQLKAEEKAPNPATVSHVSQAERETLGDEPPPHTDEDAPA